MTSRRGFLLGLGSVLAAPAIVKAESLMKIAVLRADVMQAPILDLASPWVPCDGRLLLRELYAELFQAIGTTYGEGDGVSTFRLPEMRPVLIGPTDAPRIYTPLLRALPSVEGELPTPVGSTALQFDFRPKVSP